MAAAANLVGELRRDDDVCPVCKTERYMNRDMKLLVGSCLHKMCESCVDRLFSRGPSPCPICRQILRRIHFVAQTFEDLVVEKEVRIRKKVQKFFNKRQTDFPDLKSYNDYLEEVEDITFNLVNGVDVEDTEARIQRFARENRELIAANSIRDANEQRLIGLRGEQEKLEKKLQHKAYLRAIEEEKAMLRAEKEEIISEMASSDKSAKAIARSVTLKRSSMRRQLAKETLLSAPVSAELSYLEHEARRQRLVRQQEEDELATRADDGFRAWESNYEDLDLFEFRGAYDDPFTRPLAEGPKARAGGFLVEIAYRHGLEAAYLGLLAAPV